jgi:DNA (cytosine-5)-methyltransferase 1
VVVENVVGLLTSHGGADFTALCRAWPSQGYRFGALEIDAAASCPQSRPRVFVIATRLPVERAGRSSPSTPAPCARPTPACPPTCKAAWTWWGLDPPAGPQHRSGRPARTRRPGRLARRIRHGALLALMAPAHRAAVEARIQSGERSVGAVFRRMRGGQQRAEVRFDGLAGCLRTPRGGSSRQTLLVIDNGQVRSRLLSPREGARLMGLPDAIACRARATAGLHVIGDGVAAPVVRWLAERLLTPLDQEICASPPNEPLTRQIPRPKVD